MIGRALGSRAALLAVLAAWGCAGDGSALFQQVVDPQDPGTDAPTLAELQNEIFSPTCSACHNPNGPGPFRLDAIEASYDALVNVVSLCPSPLPCGGLSRVEPFNPDESYIVWKLEGTPGIAGARMPRGGLPPLEQEQIDRVRAWIEAGALP